MYVLVRPDQVSRRTRTPYWHILTADMRRLKDIQLGL